MTLHARALAFAASLGRHRAAWVGLLLVAAALALLTVARAAVSHIDSNTAGSFLFDANSITLTKPTGTTTNDVMVVAVANRFNHSFSAPAGWTQRIVSNGTQNPGLTIFTKTATASEPGSYTFSLPTFTTAVLAGTISSFRGVDTSNPIAAIAVQANAAAGTSTAPSITPGVANAMLVAIWSSTGSTATPPAGMTTVASASGSTLIYAVDVVTAYQSITSTAATGTRVAGLSPGDASNAVLLALRPAVSYTISGKVFEDVNYGGGAGRSLSTAGGVVRAGATVELYNASGTYVSSTTTDAAGAYSFTVTSAAVFHVRVVNSTVTSSRTGANATLRAVQTFETDASSGSAVAVTNAVGGTNPDVVDPGAAVAGAAFNPTTGVFSAGLSGTAQSYSVVSTTGGSVSGVDFGFNFSTIVNNNDSGQGSLRQFVTNAAALGGQASMAQSGFRRTGSDALEALPAGIETSIFMIPNGTAVPGIASTVASQLTGGVAVITLSSVLPNLPTSRVSLDGSTQSANIGNANPGFLGTGGTVGADAIALAQVPMPEVQVTGPGGTYGMYLSGSNQTVRCLALTRFYHDIYVWNTGSGNLVEFNVLGSGATAFTDPGTTALRSDYGIYWDQSTNGTIRNNLFGWHDYHGIYVTTGTGLAVTGNEIRSNGQIDGTSAGVKFIPTSSGSITANLIAGNAGNGIDLFSLSSSNTVTNNTVSGNGMRALEYNGIRVYGNSNTIDRNIVTGNYRSGINIYGGTFNKITQNQAHANGGVVASMTGTAATTGLGIDLANDNAVAANNGTRSAGLANYEMDTPVFTSATISGSTLTVTGYVGSAAGQAAFANVTVEVFKSSNDASGYGEGPVYLGSVTTSSSNGNFSGTISTAAVAVGDSLTGTATDSLNNTSEFGANKVILAQISGTVFEDLNYGGGAGRTQAASGGAGVSGATVELYSASTGALAASTTTASNGSYSFAGVGGGGYFVRVVQSTVRSTRGGSVAGLLPVQTWRYEASWQTPAAVSDEVGGARPDVADSAAAPALTWTQCATELGGSSNPCAFTGTRLVRYGVGSSWTTRVATGGVACSNAVFGDPAVGLAKTCEVLQTNLHSASSVHVLTGNAGGVDFGFNFDTVTNINDSGQGSLRQAITNANTLTGDNLLVQAGRTAAVENLVFMIPNGNTANGDLATGGELALSGGLRSGLNAFSAGAATITLASGLPTLSAALIVDAQTQPGWTATPVLVVDGNTLSANGINVGATAGGSTVSGLVIRRFTGHGVAIASGAAGVSITGNHIGRLNAAGTDAGAAYANTINGVDVGGNGAIIGGNSATLRNVIAGNTGMGIRIAGNGATVRGNHVGVDVSGSTKLANGGYGIDVTPNVLNALVGGAGLNEGNVVSGNGNAGVIYEVGSTGSVKGNRLGTDAGGTVSIAGNGAAVFVAAAGVVIGGTEANAGNSISGSNTAGVVVAGTTTNGVTISSNSIFGNAGLGIDLGNNGVTANDGAKPTSQPNLYMDYPVLTSAALGGSTLAVTGYVGNAAGQSTFGLARVEFFTSDGTQTNGQGKTYLGFLTADASGNFSGTLTGVSGLTAGTSKLTATATDGSGNTSEFAVNVTVGSTSVGGTVFEDLNYGGGAGRSLAASGGVGVSGATVELYGVASGALVASTTTGVGGSYTFAGQPAGAYIVRVVQSTVRSTRAGSIAGLLPVQTWRYEASSQNPAAVSDEVGGAQPGVADSAAALALAWTSCAAQGAVCSVTGTRLVRYGVDTRWYTRVVTGNVTCNNATFGDPAYGVTTKSCEILQPHLHSASSLQLVGSTASGVDFGFNFDTVTNTNDSGPGSLRQAITNANTLTGDNLLAQVGRTGGVENLVFMIANGSSAAGLRSAYNFFTTSAGSYNVATVTATAVLPIVTAPLVLDAQTQPGWSANPIIEINGNSLGGNLMRLSGGGSALRGFVLNRSASNINSSLRIDTAGGNTVHGNWFGVDAAGSAAPAQRASHQIELYSGGNTIGGSGGAAQRNVISNGASNGLVIWSGDANVVQGNYIGTNANGDAALGSGDSGVAIPGAATNTVIGGINAGEGNVISGNLGSTVNYAGISIQNTGATGTLIRGNRIGLAATGSSSLGNAGYGIYTVAANTTIGGTASGAGNVISASGRAGVAVVGASASGVVVQGNSIYGNTGLGIDLAIDGISANDGAKPSGQPNLLMDHPVFTSASLSGTTLTVAGYVGSAAGQATFAGARVEVFISDATSANGQGKTYLGYFTADASGNFSGTIPNANAYGITGGTTKLTGTATDGSGNTSEFGANVTLGFGLSGFVYEDLNYGGGAGRSKVFASGGSGRSGARVELYTVSGSTATYSAATTTDGLGAYAFSGLAAGNYAVRVVGASVSSSRTGYTAALLPVLTYRADASSGTAANVSDNVGGTTPAATDGGNGAAATAFSTSTGVFSAGTTGTAQAYSLATVSSGVVSGLDFGFNFDTVVNTNDSGAGSLRQAISNANALGGDSSLAQSGRTAAIENLVFMIPNGTTGAGGSLNLSAGGLRSSLNYFTTAAGSYNVATVAASSRLLITSALVVDAQTQPGWTLEPRLEIRGDAAGAADGLVSLSGGAVTLRGLVLNRYGGEGVKATDNSSGHVIQGCWIGVTAAGDASAAIGLSSIWLAGTGSNHVIGGTSAAQRNVLAGTTSFEGLSIWGGSGHLIQGNYIGTNSTGSVAIPTTSWGIKLYPGVSNSTVGGTASGAGNVISGSLKQGLYLMGSGVTVQGNFIGTNAGGGTAIANALGGILIEGSNHVVGGTSTAARNLVSGNGGTGIAVSGTGHSIAGNYIGTDATGTAALGNASGVTVSSGSGSTIGGNSAGERNVVSGNRGEGVIVNGGSVVVSGNYIGTNAAGSGAVPNAGEGGVLVNGGSGSTIGGTASGAGNVISGNSGRAVTIYGGSHTVAGNYLGVSASGSAALVNTGGSTVYLGGSAGAQTIGGLTAAARNVIVNTNYHGINIAVASATGTLIQGNYIGTDASGVNVLGGITSNGLGGVFVNGTATGIAIGGTATGAGNLIRGFGVGVLLGSSGSGNAVLGNAIYGNGSIGIDIGGDGVTANDGVKTAGQPNLRMDFPVFSSARARSNQLTVAGYIGTAAGQSVFANARVELFASDDDSSGYGEGRTYLGALTADASGNFSGTVTMPVGSLKIGTRLTATATDASGNTSEFGPNFSALIVDFVVNDPGDATDANPGDGDCATAAGVCTLRAALTELNAWVSLPVTPTVTFALPGCTATGATACTITPATALPSVTRAMVLDASTQTGTRSVASACAPIVEVDGSGAPASSSGLVIAADGSTVRGFSIGGFGQSGVSLSASTLAIECNHIGLRADGSTVRRNGAVNSMTGGVYVNSGSGIVIGGSTAAQRNVLSGNGGAGVWVNGGTVTIQGNYAGTDATGLAGRGNGRWGVHLEGGANHVVGGAGGTLGNLISGNVAFETGGLYLRANGSTVLGNIVGMNATQSAALPNGDASSGFASGIDARAGSGHVIGGTGSGEANVIAGNQGNGIRVTATSARISGNSIYGNLWHGIDLNADGVSANDGTTSALAPNNGMDHPVLTGAGIASPATSMTVSGYVGTGSGQAVFAGARIEFFKAAPDSTGYGQGQTYLGFLTADANGRFTGTIAFASGLVAVGDAITATATDAAGNTSEFGPNWTSTTIAGLAPAGFNAFDTDAASTALSGVIRSRTAGSASSFAVIALDSAGTGLHPGFTGSVSLRWLDARNDSGAITGSCRASWVDLGAAGTASFTANARVTVSLTPPATATRSMRLQMVYAGPAGTVTACSNDAFAGLPSTLAWLDASDTDAATAGTVRTLNNVGASGGVVHRAGRPFTLRAEARDATGALMTGYDGTPTLAITGCLLPSGCTAGALSATATTAVAGAYLNSSVSYAEVGAISVGLTDAGYAAVDAADTTLAARTIASANLSVGRFVPDSYSASLATSGQLATANGACLASGSGATFLGQGFGWVTAPQVTLTARNAAGATTALWTGTLMKITPSSGLAASLAASGAGAATVAASYGAFTVSDLGAGQVRVTASSTDRFVLDLAAGSVQASVTPSWAWALAVADASEAAVAGNPTLAASVTQSGVGFDQGAVFHSGRLALAPGYGDARAGVRLVAQLQRYTSAGWVTMTEDQGCVTVQPQNLGVATPSGVFTTSGLCAAPLAAAATTRGGRAWLTLPATPGAAPGRLQMQLAGSAATGSACSSAGALQAVVPMGLPWLLGGSSAAGPQALGTWGTTQRDTVLRRETW